MKQFWGFLTKEFFHIFRDKRTLIILFGIPIAQVLLFGFVVTNEIKDVNIAILDHSKDEVSSKITDKLLSSGYFKLYKNINNEREIEDIFKEGSIREVIIFEQDFGKKLLRNNKADLQIIADASDANTANLIVNYTSAIVNDYARTYLSANIPAQITSEVRMYYNPELKGVFMFVPGIIAMILILISVLLTSISIVREKEMGTMEILLVSPLKPWQIIVGKVIPYFLLSFVNAAMIIMVGKFVFGLPIEGSIILLLSECMLYILLSLSIGIFISTVTDNQQAAMMISQFSLMLPTILLSGFIFPVENMPVILQAICQAMPAKWFIVILKNIMLQGGGIDYIWKETLVLFSMTVFFMILSIKMFKIRLE